MTYGKPSNLLQPPPTSEGRLEVRIELILKEKVHFPSNLQPFWLLNIPPIYFLHFRGGGY